MIQGEFQCPIQFQYYNLEQQQPMSLYSNHSRNQTNYQHQYSHKDQIHSRSHSQYWREKNELDYPRGTITQNEESKISVPRYQHEKVEQKYHQRSQEESNKTTQYYEQMSPNRSKYNDFSFEDRIQKVKMQASNQTFVRQNARKKGTEMKINNIDQLNDKIYGLLSLIKKEIHKSNSRKKQRHDVSLSPSKNNQSQYQQTSFDYSNRNKDNQANSNSTFNRYNIQSTNQLSPLSSIENQKYANRSISGKKTKVEYSNNAPINPHRALLTQNSQNIIDRRENTSHNKFVKQPQRQSKSPYENNTSKQFIKKRQESLVMKSIEELLNQRRKILNIKREEQPIYSYGKGIEIESKKQEGSPIHQFKNQQKVLYTIQQNETESLTTPTECNKPKKYQYFVQNSNQDQVQIQSQKHFDFTGKIYKKSQQLTPKQSKPRLEIELS